MRRILPPLLTALILVSAGCLGFGDDDEPPTTTTGTSPTPGPSPTPTATPTTTPTGTPTTPTNTTPTATPTPTPTPTPPKPPKEVLNFTYDFAQGDATGQSPQVETFTVDAGYANLTINLTVVARDIIGNPIGIGTGAEVALLDPTGEEVMTWEADAEAVVEGTTAAIAGEWSVEFRGAASTTATIRIVEEG